MTQRQPTRRHPHEDAPDCPICETDLFVYARKSDTTGDWECGHCGWKSWLPGSGRVRDESGDTVELEVEVIE